MRMGMSSGAQNGTYDSHTTSGFVGSHGAMLTPMMYGIIISVMTGAVTEPTSSCRDTSAASAPSASAYIVKPTTNQMTTQSAVVPRLIELVSTSPSAKAVPAPAADDEHHLRQPDHADAQHLAGHELPRPDGRQQQLDHAARLLLDHALRHQLARRSSAR